MGSVRHWYWNSNATWPIRWARLFLGLVGRFWTSGSLLRGADEYDFRLSPSVAASVAWKLHQPRGRR